MKHIYRNEKLGIIAGSYLPIKDLNVGTKVVCLVSRTNSSCSS